MHPRKEGRKAPILVVLLLAEPGARPGNKKNSVVDLPPETNKRTEPGLLPACWVLLASLRQTLHPLSQFLSPSGALWLSQ